MHGAKLRGIMGGFSSCPGSRRTMESGPKTSAAGFSREILTRHPHITFEHASAAARDFGLPALPRRVFFATVKEMGIQRDDAVEGEEPASAQSRQLLEQLDHLRDECRETAKIRKALSDVRTVVRAALAQDL